MAHILASEGKDSDLAYDDAYRLFLITRTEPHADYRFGRTKLKRDHARARSSFRGVQGFLKNMIEAVANSKMRRLERELELRGVRYGRPNNDWVSDDSTQNSVRKR